jgi:hypothetical protein
MRRLWGKPMLSNGKRLFWMNRVQLADIGLIDRFLKSIEHERVSFFFSHGYTCTCMQVLYQQRGEGTISSWVHVPVALVLVLRH